MTKARKTEVSKVMGKSRIQKTGDSRQQNGKDRNIGKMEGWNVGTAGQKSESFDRNRNFLTISSILS
jgi:hypothetical protein